MRRRFLFRRFLLLGGEWAQEQVERHPYMGVAVALGLLAAILAVAMAPAWMLEAFR